MHQLIVWMMGLQTLRSWTRLTPMLPSDCSQTTLLDCRLPFATWSVAFALSAVLTSLALHILIYTLG